MQNTNTDKTKMNFFKAIGLVGIFGFAAIGSMLLGLFLDDQLGTKPIITIVLPTIIIVTQWVVLTRILLTNKDEQIAEQIDESSNS